MKKMTAMLLALCCLLLGGLALAEEGAAMPTGDALWLWDELNDSAYVEGALQGDVTVPASIDGHDTVALHFNALCDQNSVTSLTLPEGLLALQETAVANMTGLQTVVLNEGLEVISGSNFNRCPALTSVTVPASVRLIDTSFQMCESLREIRFTGVCPTFITDAFTFYWLADDYVIYVPDDQYDAYAAALAGVNDAVDHLQPSGQNAIACNTAAAEEWFTFDAATGAITGYIARHAYVEIPRSIGGVAVKSIGEGALRRDMYIYGLVLPEGLETVGKGAFEEAENILYIKLPSTLKAVEDDAFNSVPGTRIDWSEGLETIGARAFKDIMSTALTLPDSVKTIGESAFESTWIQELHLGANVESIAARAFADCSLTYMAFDLYAPIDMAADAFAGNDALADLDLPWDCSLENHAAYAERFRELHPACTVWINNPPSPDVAETPETDVAITTFENGVWTAYRGEKPNLTTWAIFDDHDVTGLGDGVFQGSQTIRSFYPHHCFWFTTIGNEAFADSTVEYVELFGSITTIGNGAFRNCRNITELTLPASLTSIGADALAGCDNLQKLTVLCDPAVLPDGLLDECFAHTEIYAAPNATAEQVRLLSEKAHRPWYAPVARLGETVNDLVEMPYAMQLIDDYWYDTGYARLDRYQGYELNLYLPREAEGVTLNTLGGDMMGRSRAGDNCDMELPVRSVVIPENYTNIYTTTFAGCETLETIICYAPLEAVPYGMFEGCTSLREVVFVNGVRTLDAGAFNGCTSLETVYVGPYVENIADVAGQMNLITDPALMPDVEALLAAVKSDPMPKPTAAPTAAPAAPAGEADAYLGTWKADTLEMEGETYPVGDMGMEMYLTLNADGTATSFDGESTATDTWHLENGTVVMTDMALPMDAEGRLFMEMDGMKLTFVKDGDTPAAPAAPDAPAAPAGEADAYLGTWKADTLEMEGETYPVGDMGMEMYLTLNADGTAESRDTESNETGVWVMENGVMVVDGVPVTLEADGRLLMADEDSRLFFVKTDTAPAAPAEPAASALDVSSRMDIRYTAKSAETNGVTMDASMLGAEYSLTFHADGTADFVMAGTPVPGLSWTQGEGIITVDYYGTPMQVTPTGEGFDLNFFDSMLLHLVPAE